VVGETMTMSVVARAMSEASVAIRTQCHTAMTTATAVGPCPMRTGGTPSHHMRTTTTPRGAVDQRHAAGVM